MLGAQPVVLSSPPFCNLFTTRAYLKIMPLVGGAYHGVIHQRSYLSSEIPG